MDTLSLTDLSQFIHHDGELFSNWVYVSSLAMRSYKKSPLLRRWCCVRQDDERQKIYLEFFINEDDFEPTKRISLCHARLVVSRGAKLTKAQFARIDRDLGPASPTFTSGSGNSADSQIAAFYIDFPKKFLKDDVVSRDNTIYETRSVRIADNGKDEFPLGFIMVSPNVKDAAQLETALSQGCHVTIPREKKRLKVQRWMNRAWMKLRGELSIDQFDEAGSTAGTQQNHGEDIFFTVAPPRRGVVPRIESLDATDLWPDEAASGTSFITAGSSDDEDSQDEKIEKIALDGFQTALGDEKCSLTRSTDDREFSSIEAMLAEKSDDIRHSTKISKSEILSVIDYVEQTRKFSLSPSSISPGWSLCSEGENFDCFKSIDESTGIVRTRTWAKLRNIPPQTLFHILYQTEARKSWDHHYARFESEWTDPSDRNLDIIDAVVTAPFGCANREFLEWRRRHVPEPNRPDRDGIWVIYLRSYDDVNRSRPPVDKNNVRAEVWLSGYLIQWWKDSSSGEVIGSQVMVMTQIDVKGLIPKYLVNALSSSGPKRWVKSVTAAAISEIESVRKTTPNDIMKLTDVQLDELYQIHQ